jgi:hypothetical protein
MAALLDEGMAPRKFQALTKKLAVIDEGSAP